MACSSIMVEWKSCNVGRLLCGLRSMVDPEGVSSTPQDDRPRGRGTSCCRLSILQKYLLLLRNAMVDTYQWFNCEQCCFWRQQVLDREISRTPLETFALPRLGQDSRQHVNGLPQLGNQAPRSR